jgi:hypothetical protein
MDAPLDYLPRWPRRKDFRIGCAGAGFIMRDCHLVAYRQAGFNPVAIASRDPARARAAADQHSVPRVHATYEALLDDPEIEVLDVAVPPDAQPALIHAACRRNGHVRGILAQKPLALSYREAHECVAACAAAGVVLAVNQNMRYDQSVRALKDLLRRGWLGEPVLGTVEMRAVPHWMPWSEGLPSLSTFIMSIHHLDTFRHWFGTPDRVLASTRPDPRTRFPHEDGINLYVLEYDGGCRASAWDDVWAGPIHEGAAGDAYVRWRVELAELPRPHAQHPRLRHAPPAGRVGAAALAGGVVPRRLRRHHGATALCPGGRRRAGDKRPRQPGDGGPVRGRPRRREGAPRHHRPRVPHPADITGRFGIHGSFAATGRY